MPQGELLVGAPTAPLDYPPSPASSLRDTCAGDFLSRAKTACLPFRDLLCESTVGNAEAVCLTMATSSGTRNSYIHTQEPAADSPSLQRVSKCCPTVRLELERRVVG